MDYDPDIGGANMRSIPLDNLSDDVRRALLDHLGGAQEVPGELEVAESGPFDQNQMARAAALYHAAKVFEGRGVDTSALMKTANWIVYGPRPPLMWLVTRWMR